MKTMIVNKKLKLTVWQNTVLALILVVILVLTVQQVINVLLMMIAQIFVLSLEGVHAQVIPTSLEHVYQMKFDCAAAYPCVLEPGGPVTCDPGCETDERCTVQDFFGFKVCGPAVK